MKFKKSYNFEDEKGVVDLIKDSIALAIKKLKTGWSDSAEDVTGLKMMLSERKREMEDLKAKLKVAEDMATQVRGGFQEMLRNAEKVAIS